MHFHSIRRVKQPDFEPVTLSEAKAHLRIMECVTEDDAYLIGLIAAARHYFENRVGQTTTRTQWRAKVHGWWTCSCMGAEVPYPPLAGDASGHGVTLSWDGGTADAADIVVDAIAYPGTVRYDGADGPPCDKGDATITWWAGVDSPSDIPALWKSAMLMLIGHWYENRQAVVTDSGAMEVPMSFDLIVGACSFDGRG